jgi:cell division protein FtsB
MNAGWLLKSSTLWGALGCSALLSTLVLWVSPDGASSLRRRETELREAQVKLLNINRRNLELFEEVQKLAKKDPELMEGLARRRGMVRPGETVYTFRNQRGQ